VQPTRKNEPCSEQRDYGGSDYGRSPMSLRHIVLDKNCIESDRGGGEPELLVANVSVICIHR